MKKVGIVSALAAVVMVVGVTEAQASSSICRAPDKCTAITADDHVDAAVVSTDRDTRGAYSLRCHKGSIFGGGQESVQRGFLVEGDRKVIAPEINNAECVLRARGHSPRIAKVHVALTS